MPPGAAAAASQPGARPPAPGVEPAPRRRCAAADQPPPRRRPAAVSPRRLDEEEHEEEEVVPPRSRGVRCRGLSTSSARDTVTSEHQHAVPPPHPQPLPLPLPCCCRRQPPPPPAALMPSQAACVRAAVDGVPALLQPLEAHRSILTGSLRGALASRPRRWSPASPQHVPRQARGARPHVARPAARVACVLLSATFIG